MTDSGVDKPTIRFGTDGIRGVANVDLTPEVALALGRAVVRVIGGDWLTGRDTRASGETLDAAFCVGVAAEGADVSRLGVIPTPGVAYLSGKSRRPAASITASHNPVQYNGIKIIGPGGSKLSEALEDEVEAEFHRLLSSTAGDARLASAGERPPKWGQIGDDAALATSYGDWLVEVASTGGLSPFGLSVGLDCGNGAAAGIAASVFARLGCSVRVIHDAPDGVNINASCGSTDTGDLARLVVAEGLEVGFAFDGDADRVVAVDATGEEVDGDQIMAMVSIERKANGGLDSNRLVVTEWSNLGLLNSMRSHGIDVSITPVGDRFVYEEMERTGATLGGEQSGHIIFGDLAPTGDGMMTALKVAELMARRKVSLAALAQSAMVRLPQVSGVVAVGQSPKVVAGRIGHLLSAENEALAGRGRLVIRPSGTEAVVRVMAEAADASEAAALVERMSEAIRLADTASTEAK